MNVKKFYAALGNLFLLFCFTILVSDCYDSSTLPSPTQFGVMSGQVYNLSHPGPIPIGWKPPPFETASTINVLNINKKFIAELESDDKGKFIISLQQGSYFLIVKESPLRVETGPFAVSSGKTISVDAYFDNGMR